MKVFKDLRGLDEKGFKETYEYLKERTNNFKELPPEIITENSRNLLFVRLCLGMSQKDFGKALGVTKDWCRHTEAGRNKIVHKTIAMRYSGKLETFLKERNINYNSVLQRWKEYKFLREQNLQEIKTKFNSISKMDEKELIRLYKTVKSYTGNFSKIENSLFMDIPQAILLFRIMSCTNHRKFAKLMGINDRTIRRYEHVTMKVKPQTAAKFSKVFNEKFDKSNFLISEKKLIENFRILTNFYGHRNLDAMMNHGLNMLAKIKRTSFENEIFEMLKKNNIGVERYGIIEGVKKKFNIDFIIPSANNPKIAIEVFEFSVGGKSKNVRSKVCSIDHRFQSLKLRYPEIKTVMVIKLIGKPVLLDFIRKSIDKELLNTDFYLINNEIKFLPKKIKEIFTTN